MEFCKVFLVCLIVLSCVTYGSFTKEANTCYPNIPCDDGRCIEREDWCDKYPHCFDESDETYCETKGFFSTPDNKCNETLHFECANKKCVPRALECDGFDDCKDKSDEKNCPESGKDGKLQTESEDRSTTPQPVSVSAFQPNLDNSRTTSLPVSAQETHSRGDVPFHLDSRSTQAPIIPQEYHSRGGEPFHHNPRATQAPITPQEYHHQDPSATPAPQPHHTHHRPVTGPQTGRDRPPALPRSWPLPAFRFAEDRAQDFGRRYGGELVRAEQWLLGQEVTPRSLVALSLAGSSFRPNTTHYEVIRRRLKLELGAKLLRIRENPMNVHELAMYINALMATCQDPRQIYGQDLVSLLFHKTHDPRLRIMPSPFPLLTLCLANSSVTDEDFAFLEYMVDSTIIGEVLKDRFILSISALACIQKRGLYAYELKRVLDTASRKLLDQQYDDGSFGSIYSTALAVQAFFALDSNVWNPDKTLDFLIRHQFHDGSFGDMLATSYILPVLSGRSLIHLRNTECEAPKDETSSEVGDRDTTGPKKTIWYSLAVGLEQRNRITWQITVPYEANFFEIMQEAQKLHPRFRFLHTESYGKIDVYTISDIPNDPERGTYWQLFVLDRRDQIVHGNQIYYGDIRALIPGDNQELLYWYLPYRGRFS